MKDVVLDEVMKELNFIERIVVRLFKKTFIKIYVKGKINYFESFQLPENYPKIKTKKYKPLICKCFNGLLGAPGE